MNTTLHQLGEQYLSQCPALRARIKLLRRLHKTAPARELRGIEQRIASLYEEHGHLKKTGMYLLGYYARTGVEPAGDARPTGAPR